MSKVEVSPKEPGYQPKNKPDKPPKPSKKASLAAPSVISQPRCAIALIGVAEVVKSATTLLVKAVKITVRPTAAGLKIL